MQGIPLPVLPGILFFPVKLTWQFSEASFAAKHVPSLYSTFYLVFLTVKLASQPGREVLKMPNAQKRCLKQGNDCYRYKSLGNVSLVNIPSITLTSLRQLPSLCSVHKSVLMTHSWLRTTTLEHFFLSCYLFIRDFFTSREP